MKVAINYTVYLGESSFQELSDYMKQRHSEIILELGYELCCNTYGIHRNAERLHLHYHTINDIGEEKIFKDKGLVSKIKRLKCYQNYTLPNKDFKIPEVKISINYENNIDYDEKKILAYPLKEYDNNSNMVKEVGILDCYGVTEDQLEQYRKYSHSIYEKSRREYEKKEKKKTTKDDLYSHLDSVVVKSNLLDFDGEIQTTVRYVVKQMLIYYKTNGKNFSIHQLKNQAINYLYFSDIISENQICNYINI